MDFFKPEDSDVEGKRFDKLGGLILPVVSISLSKANRLLRERGQVVTGYFETMKSFGAEFSNWTTEASGDKRDSHRALLICVEPLEQDSADKFVKDFVWRRYIYVTGDAGFDAKRMQKLMKWLKAADPWLREKT